MSASIGQVGQGLGRGVCKPWTGGAGAGEGCLQALDRWSRGWRGVSASLGQVEQGLERGVCKPWTGGAGAGEGCL